jgi:hypothetical protein
VSLCSNALTPSISALQSAALWAWRSAIRYCNADQWKYSERSKQVAELRDSMLAAAAAEAERRQEETSEPAHITAVNAQLQAALTTAEVSISITSFFTH